MTTTTTNIRLIKCGVCRGAGTLTALDWNSSETLPPRKTSPCWMCAGKGKHPALPDDYQAYLTALPSPEPAPVRKHAFITLRCREMSLRITRQQRRRTRRYALAQISPASRARLERLTRWEGWNIDAQDTTSGAVIGLLHRP